MVITVKMMINATTQEQFDKLWDRAMDIERKKYVNALSKRRPQQIDNCAVCDFRITTCSFKVECMNRK